MSSSRSLKCSRWRISPSQMSSLREIYFAHCDEEGNLWRNDLRSLMASLGHPEDEVELEAIMHEWDVQNTGYLDFDAFISMIAVVLKKEELDESVEDDFLKLTSKRVVDVQTGGAEALRNAADAQISADSLIRGLTDLGAISLDFDLIEEMIFDADFDGAGFVSLDDLISTIEIIGRKEIVGSGGGASNLEGVPTQQQGRVVLAKLKSEYALSLSGTFASPASPQEMTTPSLSPNGSPSPWENQ